MIAYGQGVSIEAFGLPPITHLIGAKIGQGRQHQQFFSRAELGKYGRDAIKGSSNLDESRLIWHHAAALVEVGPEKTLLTSDICG
jgi:hypothetical protein